MQRLGRVVAVVLLAGLGVVAGAATVLNLGSSGEPEPRIAASPTAPSPPSSSSPLPRPDEEVLLVWTPGGLSAGLADAVAGLDAVSHVTTVHGDVADLVASRTAGGNRVDRLDGGWAIPLDTFAIHPDGYASFVPAPQRHLVTGLEAGQGLLSRTSAELRGVGPGGVLRLASGHQITITGVLDDTAVGAAELVVTRETGRRIGVDTPRHLLVEYRGERDDVEAAVRDVATDPTRVRGPAKTPLLRYGDAVLPQSHIKQRFGEFAYRRDPDATGFEQDPGWQRTHIVTADVPLLGEVRCHRGIVKALTAAMADLRDRNLAHLVDPDAYAGCHNPRLTRPGASVSRHAWGVAVDLNYEDNPTGLNAQQDDRLVDTMRRHGFTWGGFWLVPDPAHFEYYREP